VHYNPHAWKAQWSELVKRGCQGTRLKLCWQAGLGCTHKCSCRGNLYGDKECMEKNRRPY